MVVEVYQREASINTLSDACGSNRLKRLMWELFLSLMKEEKQRLKERFRLVRLAGKWRGLRVSEINKDLKSGSDACGSNRLKHLTWELFLSLMKEEKQRLKERFRLVIILGLLWPCSFHVCFFLKKKKLFF